MSASFLDEVGFGQASSSGLTLVGSPDQDVDPGVLLVVFVATYQLGVTGGATNYHTSLEDDSGNSWQKLDEYTNTAGGGFGATGSIWCSTIIGPLTTASVITAHFAAAATERVMGFATFDLGGEVGVAVVGANHAVGDITTTSVTVSGLPSAEYFYLGGVFMRRPAADSVTPDADFGICIGPIDNGSGSGGSRIKILGQYRLDTSTGDTLANVFGNSDGWVTTLLALKLVGLTMAITGSSTLAGALSPAPPGGQGTLRYLGTIGQRLLDTSASTTVTVTTVREAPAGCLLVVRCASGQVTEDEGPSVGGHLLTDDEGTAYAKLGEVSRTGAGVASGITLSAWWTIPEEPLPEGTVLTLTLAASVNARGFSVDIYDLGTDFDVSLVGVAMASGEGDPASDALEVTLSGLPEADRAYRFMGTGGWDEGRAEYADLTLGWGWDLEPVFEPNTGRNIATNFWGMGRSLQDVGVTWPMSAPTVSGSKRWAMILVAWLPSDTPLPPPEETPEGARQYQQDFMGDNYGLVGASIVRRPDAISLDYLTAFAPGPRVIGNALDGIDPYRWRVRAAPGAVYLQRSNAELTLWETEVELFTYTGQAILEVSLAFTGLGYPIVAAERKTGAGASEEVWLYNGVDESWANLGAGRTPRVVLDYVGGCGPAPNVQLFYLKPEVGLVRYTDQLLDDEEPFTVEYSTPLEYNRRYFLENAFVTTDKRVSLVYSVHDEAAGTWALARVNSRSLRPEAPHFRPAPGTLDVYWMGGSLFYDPDHTVTENVSLWVEAPQEYDAIELECRDGWPRAGRDEPVPVWPEELKQEWAPVGGVGRGDVHEFAIEMTHGQDGFGIDPLWQSLPGGPFGQMAPNSFRIRGRTAKDGGGFCYTSWRYFLAIPTGVPNDLTDPLRSAFSSRCGGVGISALLDLSLTSNAYNPIQVNQWNNPQAATCDDDPPGYNFTEWGIPTIGGFRTDFGIFQRKRLRTAWHDEDGSAFVFYGSGQIYASVVGGAGGPNPPAPGQSPLEFSVDDQFGGFLPTVTILPSPDYLPPTVTINPPI